MTSDKEAVYADLVEAVTTVSSQCFEESGLFTIGQDNWYPDLLFRQETPIIYETADDVTIEVPTRDDGDIKTSLGGDEHYFKHIAGARQTLTDALTARKFVTETYEDPETGQGRLRVFGWDRDPPWFRVGDYLKVYRWRTPMEVVHVCPAGEQLPEEFPVPTTGDGQYIGADSLHLCLRGQRGGEYLVNDDGDTMSLYQREDAAADTLQKMADLNRTIFVGNPETGPRLDSATDDT